MKTKIFTMVLLLIFTGTALADDSLQVKVDELENRVDKLEAVPHGYNITPVIYSGYCTIELKRPFAPFSKFCLDGDDLNTALYYFNVDISGDITVLVSGFYKINIHAFAQILGLETVHFNVNSQTVETAIGDEIKMNIMWPLNKGDVVNFMFAGPDQYRKGDLPYFPRTAEKPNRLEIQYLGPLL